MAQQVVDGFGVADETTDDKNPTLEVSSFHCAIPRAKTVN
jgi:hypothetical protein